jgi:hypothetical protein
MHQAYELVQERFRAEIATGRVKLHRGDSLDVAATIPDQTLDWVYIDAMHDYENVLIDLVAYKDKVKPTGFILGHDFSNNPKSRKQGFGVVAAVRDFVAAEGFQLVLITNEKAPSYLLARNGNDTTLPALKTALLSAPGCALVEIDDRRLGRYEQVAMTRADGQQSYVMRFA